MPPGVPTPSAMLVPAYYDNARKLLGVQGQKYVGVVTFGAGAIGTTEPRTVYGFMPEFQEHLVQQAADKRLKVEEVAQEIGTFFTERWQDAGMPKPTSHPDEQMFFYVAGFDEGEAYGRVFEVRVPDAPVPMEQSKNTFGLSMGGQNGYIARLLQGFDERAAQIAATQLHLDAAQVAALVTEWKTQLSVPIPWQFLPLQDGVDLCTFIVTTTSIIQNWTVDIRGVGGEIDVAVIDRVDGLRVVNQKQIHSWE